MDLDKNTSEATKNHRTPANQIESDWYRGFKRYDCDADILADQSLISFGRSKNTHEYLKAKFLFIHLQESALRRIPNRLRRAYRCLLNHPARGTMGLKNIYCPRQTLTYLNQLSERISQLAKLEAPFPYLVTSILRTQEHQNHLQKIGYPVLGESSHCTGYAADVEQLWYEKNMPSVHKTMQKLLQQDFGEMRINLIDYQRFWHVCLNPFHPENHIAAKSCD